MITFWEITGIVILTSILLILFFPKQSIEKAIEQEQSNYDLTLIYLKSIAHAYPEDPGNWLRLINAQLRMGQTEEAEKILHKLKNLPNLNKIYLEILSYQLIRTRYAKSQDKKQKAKLYGILKRRLKTFAASEEPSFWHIAIKESTALALPDITFQALQKHIAHSTLQNTAQIKEAFYLGLALHQKAKAVKIVEDAFAKSGDPALCQLLKANYLEEKAYAKAAETLYVCYQQHQNVQTLLDAAQYFFTAGEKQKAVKIVQKYQKRYLEDAVTAQKIIQLYLANDALAAAHAFALEVMQKKEVLP